MPATMPAKLDLSDAIFIPPEADEHVETVMGYWNYAFNRADSHYLEPADADPEVEAAEEILREKYPHVLAAIDRLIIARSLKRDLH